MAVIGTSPVTFISEDTSGNNGKQYQIPLSILTIGSSGTIDATVWPEWSSLKASDQALVNALLKNLISQGLLTAPAS
jgi:hypothetical protein